LTEYTKISFQHRRIREISDVTDIVVMLFPGNRNQQYAAAIVLMALRTATEPLPSMAHLEGLHKISRRTLQRTRAKLARLGLIEHVSGLSTRYSGAHGWRLSGRMGTALRALADAIDTWRYETRRERMAKEEVLIRLLR
jgi:DNA-binding transcriptional regulator YhcF (GntR family)